MKTPMTSQNVAIASLAASIAATVTSMDALALEASQHGKLGNIDGCVGALLGVQQNVEALQAQLAAVFVLHRSK